MKRGDLVRVALPGDYGKPRPALIIQSDLFEEHPSFTVLPITSEIRPTPMVRITIEPDEQTQLNARSQIMIDKAITVPREKIGGKFGSVREADMLAVNRALALFFGLA
ncbi:MAG TPA: type II toxin-antitoxin system PemK/MazF family toxin [Pseudolabrys sp.]|nr:type II toxin-antitoxin system PemK/MazF family toxin [Pseudolabrys sp.]